MITKAIVEEVVDPYSIRIRIPTIDRTYESSIRTSKSNLRVAVVCTLPNCDPNIKPGDIVIVSYDEVEEDPIILGYLYRSKEIDTFSDMIFSKLKCLNDACLPRETSVGNVTSYEIQQLTGTRGNLQHQIDALQSQINHLTSVLSTLVTKEDV